MPANEESAPEEQDTSDESHKEEWIYQGVRLNSKDKAVHQWKTPRRGELWFAKNIVSYSPIGAVYEMTCLPSGSYYTGGDRAPHYLRTLSYEERIDDSVKTREAQTRLMAISAAKRAKADNGGDVGKMTLAEIARRYRRAVMPDARAGLLALVIGYVQNGRVPETSKED